ncbi:ATP-binding protein [Streptomyces sp. NPDC048224]|uniref:ATP-binding protein n=1 Tax=Streptomyces sp. NPDC048224 TaxID=3154500 RepID=UPI0033F9B55F
MTTSVSVVPRAPWSNGAAAAAGDCPAAGSVRDYRSANPEDPMTTTAAAPCTAYRSGGDVMSERFKVATVPGRPPRPEDACRVGVMRRIAAARLRYCGLHALTDDVSVIVSELLTNALLHSATDEITLKITADGGFLRVAVHDGMPGGASPRVVDDATVESGRGLPLVNALATARGGTWGTADAGATTWCRLAVPTPVSS